MTESCARRHRHAHTPLVRFLVRVATVAVVEVAVVVVTVAGEVTLVVVVVVEVVAAPAVVENVMGAGLGLTMR